MRNRRDERGFTLVETLVAVAVLVILMAVAFIAVQNHQRTLKQLEFDEAAKEILIAAQNHLTMAKAQGELDGLTEFGEDSTISGPEYYVFYEPDDGLLQDPQSVLSVMLPPFSIDNTVRLGGSYVIEYNPDTAVVTNVFYVDAGIRAKLNGGQGFKSDDYDDLFSNYLGEEKSAERLRGYGASNQVIGWYGSDDLVSTTPEKLVAPTIKIINAERLEVEVAFKTSDLLGVLKEKNAIIQLTMRGAVSGKTQVVRLPSSTSPIGDDVMAFLNDGVQEGVHTYNRYVLDDITSSNGHFAQKWCDESDENALIPGENVTLQVKVFSNTELATIAKSTAKKTNSLFASVKKSAGASTMTIANIRHLENLDPSISGYDDEALGDAFATAAVQTKDMSWPKFKNAIAGGDDSGASDVQIYDVDGIAFDAPGGKSSFAPINPEYLTSYDGQDHKITGVVVDAKKGDAGLFGAFDPTASCSVENLALVDFDVKTADGNAGALGGSLEGVKVRNVIAYASDNEKGKVAGTEGVGGLVGSMAGGSLQATGASLYVKATANGSAGGLVGMASGDATISSSYSGGHTTEGVYATNEAPTAEAKTYINVQGSTGVAGGFVGTVQSATVKDCYATTSAKAANSVGGFAGSASGGSIKNCYATGLVSGADEESKAGAFVGTAATGLTLEECQYFEIINEGMPIAGNEREIEASEVSAIDEDAKSYNDFYKAEDAGAAAKPYDAMLPKWYGSAYPYPSVVDLAPITFAPITSIDYLKDCFVATHYGDWPSPETLIVNTKS